MKSVTELRIQGFTTNPTLMRQAGVDVTRLEARFWHFVDLDDTLSDSAEDTLVRLLEAT